jgi:CDGSH-type Zn-finger protein
MAKQKESGVPDHKKYREDGKGTGLIDGSGKSTPKPFAKGGHAKSTPKPYKRGGKHEK